MVATAINWLRQRLGIPQVRGIRLISPTGRAWPKLFVVYLDNGESNTQNQALHSLWWGVNLKFATDKTTVFAKDTYMDMLMAPEHVRYFMQCAKKTKLEYDIIKSIWDSSDYMFCD